MILDIAELGADAPLHGQVVVLGSGVAGAEVAVRLARHGRDVVLLESGRADFDPRIQALNDLEFRGKRHRALDPDASYHRYLPAELRGVSRVRQLGGTSNVWTGKWKHLQRSDFEPRPWVPNSDWPIEFDELLEHYRSVGRDYGFGDLEAEADRSEIVALRREVGAAGLKMSSFYWEESPTRTAHRFGDEMRRSQDLCVVLGATATELRQTDDGSRIAEVVVRSLEGHERRIRADHVVMATGALEAARLLLASDRIAPGGIGNAHDLVGRFYTDHLKHHEGTLRPGPLTRQYAGELQYGPKPRFCVCFALDDATQRSEELLEHALYLKPIYRQGLVARAMGRLRAPGVLRDENGVVDHYKVKFAAEQVPHPESRVALGAERDALGQRRAELHWCFTDQDHRSIGRTVDLLRERLASSGLGDLDFDGDPPTIESCTDAAHHMGTTRMANRPEEGVVDPDCRVFGTDNLYVASSAVFPTGPSYSPTFTILALARRLADHLLVRTAPTVRRS